MNGILLPDIEEKKVKILGIAPYSGMKIIMEQLAAQRPDIDLTVYVGDLEQGVKLALSSVQSDYDVLISRGGTAKMLEKASSLPVIEVGISIYDILRAIKMSENDSSHLAIVGFPNVTANAGILCELMQYSIDIIPIHSREEAADTLLELKNKNYSIVLCDMIAYTTAQKLGMNALLITSGMESVADALDQAVTLCHTCSRMMAEGRFYQDILRNASQQILVLKENGELIFSTVKPEQLDETIALLTPELSDVIRRKVSKFFKNIDNILYSCICRCIHFADHYYAVFYLTSSSVPIISGKYGIQYSSLKETEDVLVGDVFKVMNIDTEKLGELSIPVLLAGEPGTGKEQAARVIYSRSRLKANPLIIISCSLLNERSWNFLINHYNSPFNDNGNTIFLKNVNALPENRFAQLLSTIIDTSLSKRNRLIFSCECPAGKPLPKEAAELVNLLSCVTYYMKPIRERPEDIPKLCAVYLNSLSLSMANQIVGLEPEALRLLQEYAWPYNYTQLGRVLSELALMTNASYIQARDVRALLERENPAEGTANAVQKGAGGYTLDLSRPLSDITMDIIRLVLEENDGNQSAAAKQLNIGRSTLWRYLTRSTD